MNRTQFSLWMSDRHKTIGLVTGIAVFILLYLLPPPADVSDEGWRVAALAALMAIWWMTEALPLSATALVPIVILPFLGVSPFENVAQSYAHPLIFMFLGGFLISKALERWNLHTKIATVMIQSAPRSAEGIIGAIMLATAFLSMWITNTATALVMVSIAQSISRSISPQVKSDNTATDNTVQSPQDQFSTALMLGVAFSATIGGMATIIGTPPNALLVAYLQSSQGIHIGFGQWMGVGVPLVAMLLPATWLLLTRVLFNIRATDINVLGYDASSHRSVPLTAGARQVAWVSFITAMALIFRPFIQHLVPGVGISDAGILMSGALLLFILPAPASMNVAHGDRLLRWIDAEKIRWDILILFGGGLALANAVEVTGLAHAIGAIFSIIDFLPFTVVVVVAMVVMVLLGELASNTAIAAVFLPVAGAAAIAMGIPPLELVIPVGLAASIGFMLPVATPPNAIAFGSGAITSGQLLKAGALLDVISIVFVAAIALLLGPIVFGL